MGLRGFVMIAASLVLTGSVREPVPGAVSRELVNSGELSDLRWPNFTAIQSDVARFYQDREFAAAWTRGGAPTPQAQYLIRTLQSAAQKGLDAEDYDGSRWAGRLARLRPASQDPAPEDVARLDVALTVSAMRYVSSLRFGKLNPRELGFDLPDSGKTLDLAELMRQLSGGPDLKTLLERLDPAWAEYARIESALRTYLELARQPDPAPLAETKKPVEPGDDYPAAGALAKLLRRFGDLPAAAETSLEVYRGALVDAVKRFQERHGLDPDGRLGAATVTQLNTPLQHRVRQLQLALERWRWLPERFAQPPILVNIPEFRLRAYNAQGRAQLEMRVVVGGPLGHTPVFSSQMTEVIFRPHWNVPYRIQRYELAPKIAKDPGYAAKESYQILDLKGQVLDNRSVTPETLAEIRAGTLKLRQGPGSKNALGYIKFTIASRYNVHLHGTPAKALFGRARRNLSHGCIRTERPDELAAWILRDQAEWDAARIRAAQGAATSTQVSLTRAVPVLVLYNTAVVNETGEVRFFADIYRHDAALQNALDNGYPYSDWKPAGKPTSGARGRRPRE